MAADIMLRSRLDNDRKWAIVPVMMAADMPDLRDDWLTFIQLAQVHISPKEQVEVLFPYNYFKRIVGILHINCVSVDNSAGDHVGVALMGNFSFMNHSCTPNAEVLITPFRDASFRCDHQIGELDSGGRIELRSKKNIQQDEEICISYVDLRLDVKMRQERLQWAYGFHCTCPRCISEAI
jgi:hypothetical protein